jgi:hypothetical protein
MPAAPAAYSTPTWKSLAANTRFPNSTNCAQVVTDTKLIKAIMIEIERSTGWCRT